MLLDMSDDSLSIEVALIGNVDEGVGFDVRQVNPLKECMMKNILYYYHEKGFAEYMLNL